MSCIHRSHKLTDWISTYGSIHEDNTGTKWWLLLLTATVSPPSYHFSISRFSTLIILSLQIPKTWSTSFHSHINLGLLCNLRFDYSKTFGCFAWLHVFLTALPMLSQGAIIHSVLIQKLCLWEQKRSSIKFL